MVSFQGSWSLILLIAAARYLTFVARLNVVPFYPPLMERFGVTYAGIGGLYTAFFVGYALFLIPAGLAADRWPPRQQLAWGLVLTALAGAVVALSPSYPLVLAARVVQGLAVALIFTAALKLMALGFDPQQRGRATGLMEVAGGLGIFTALSLFPVLVRWLDTNLLLLSLVAMCAVVLVPLWLHPGATPASAGVRRRPPLPLREVLGRDLAFITASVVLGLFTTNGLLGWLPTHLIESVGQTPGRAGFVMALVIGGQMAGVALAGVISDHIGRRLPVAYAGAFLMALGFAGLAFFGDGLPLYGAALLVGVAMPWAVTPLIVLSTEIFGAERAGLVTSITLAFAQAFSGLTGVLFGWVLDQTGTFVVVWVLCAVLSLAEMATLAGIREGRRPPRSGGTAGIPAKAGVPR